MQGVYVLPLNCISSTVNIEILLRSCRRHQEPAARHPGQGCAGGGAGAGGARRVGGQHQRLAADHDLGLRGGRPPPRRLAAGRQHGAAGGRPHQQQEDAAQHTPHQDLLPLHLLGLH